MRLVWPIGKRPDYNKKPSTQLCMNTQIPGQERKHFCPAIACFLIKPSSNDNTSDPLQRYFPNCTEFIAAIYLMQVAARAALLRIINQRSTPVFSCSYINQIYARTGTLREGRYKSTLVDSDNYFLTVCRYVKGVRVVGISGWAV